MDRTVLHCDCNSFFASVETVFNPSYANVPMAVCGSSEERHGIVLAKNELAKSYKTIYPIASRCGVFAKTDIQPLINEGAAKEDIAANTYASVCQLEREFSNPKKSFCGLSSYDKSTCGISVLIGLVFFSCSVVLETTFASCGSPLPTWNEESSAVITELFARFALILSITLPILASYLKVVSKDIPCSCKCVA